jgi:hypothetical protein
MTPRAFGKEIKAALAPHADAQRALAMSAYMRNHFEFIGVPTPYGRCSSGCRWRMPLICWRA